MLEESTIILENSQENQTQEATFTVFKSFDSTLQKSFILQDGIIKNVTKNETDLKIFHGQSFEHSCTLPELKTFIENLSSSHALCIGLKNPNVNGDVWSQSQLDKGKIGHSRSSKNGNYSFSSRQGLIIFDYDDGDLNMDEVVAALRLALPELSNVGVLAFSSSSNGIFETTNPENQIKKNGVHIYAVIDNPQMIPQLKDLLRYRGWVQGTANYVDTTYCFSEKHIFDMSVFAPERIIIELPPKLGDGLTRSVRKIKLYEGGVIKTADVTWLSAAQQTELNNIMNVARSAAKGETVQKLRVAGHSDAQIKKIVHDMEHRFLPHTAQLQGRKSGVVVVSDIIAAIHAGTGQKFIDDDWLDIDGHTPIFGRTKLYINDDNSIVLHSFKNGGTSYTLLSDTSKFDESEFLNNTAAEPEEPTQESTAKPNSDIENFDSNADYQHLDLLQYLDDSHILKRVSQLLHEQTYIPSSSLLMVGLGVVSAYTSLSNVVVYRDGKAMPIGLYVVVEQPSGTSKSLSLNTFSEPFSNALSIAYSSIKKSLANFDISKGKPPEYLDLVAKAARIGSKFPTTNATSEAVEKSLIDGDGFFCCASSEQGLFNSLLGKSYTATGNVANADIILNGYDGGYTRTLRAGREGFVGKPVGAVTMFAQTGSIDTVVEESKGTGLSERFLCLAEPSALGIRDHTRPYPVNADLIAEYSTKCKPWCDVAASGEEIKFNHLRQLTISADDWLLIAKFKNSLEPHLLGKYSHQTLIGAAAKVEQSIMKIASNLHLMGGNAHINEIDSVHIRAAICITRDILKAFYKLCSVKGICGQSVEIDTILKMDAFQNKTTSIPMRDIIKSRSKVIPFSKMQNKSNNIRSVISEMVAMGLLVEVSKDVFRKK